MCLLLPCCILTLESSLHRVSTLDYFLIHDERSKRWALLLRMPIHSTDAVRSRPREHAGLVRAKVQYACELVASKVSGSTSGSTWASVALPASALGGFSGSVVAAG